MTKEQITKEKLKKFFLDHKYLSMRSISMEAGFSHSTINQLVGGRNITSNINDKLLPVLKKHGYKINNTNSKTKNDASNY